MSILGDWREQRDLDNQYQEQYEDLDDCSCLEDKLERLYEAADRARDERRDAEGDGHAEEMAKLQEQEECEQEKNYE